MADQSDALRNAMVDDLRDREVVVSPRIDAALRSVPRHVFLPEAPMEEAYADQAVVTKRDADGAAISSASQPTIVAAMLEQLDVQPGHHVLEIGAGTGYNAALLSHVVGAQGSVTTIDIDADTADQARERLAGLGLAGLGLSSGEPDGLPDEQPDEQPDGEVGSAAGGDETPGDVRVVHGDGGRGVPEHAPYDRIIVTAGAWDLPPGWFEQLRPDGRLVVPLSVRGQSRSIAFERTEGRWCSRDIMSCGFVPMRGEYAGPGRRVRIGDGSPVTASAENERMVEAGALWRSLRRGSTVLVQTGVSATGQLLFTGEGLWLAMTEPNACWLSATPEAVGDRLIDLPIRLWGGELGSMALVRHDSLAVAVRHGGGDADINDAEDEFPLDVRAYGAGAGEIAQRLLSSIRAWYANGRPDTSRLQVEVHPGDTPDAELSGEYVVDKPSCRLSITWTEPA